MPIFGRTNCILTASGNVALCTRLPSTPVESGLSLLSTGVLGSSVNWDLSFAVLCIANIRFNSILQERCFTTRRSVFSAICPSWSCVLIIQLECEHEFVASYCSILQNGICSCWQTNFFIREMLPI
jgi:hypothetical protein